MQIPSTLCSKGRLAVFVGVFALISLFVAFTPTLTLACSGKEDKLEGLLSMDLEELMNVEVTSAFKKPQNFRNIPAAVYVITSEDIRRSGAETIPEALRMVPGVNVAKLDNGNWAVSIRGFNGLFSDKLLVLMDGRTLYDPLFSGVFWDVQDTVLEDIERIEVIRGPGASIWGTNAVNGVINIITKNASDTVGGMVSVSGGNQNRGTLSARYGVRMGDVGATRFYVKTFKRHQQVQSDGSTAWDDWFMDRVGFRSDLKLPEANTVSLKGEMYTGRGTNKLVGLDRTYSKHVIQKNNVPVSGGYLVSDFGHRFRKGLDLFFRFYYDHTERKFSKLTSQTRDTIDFEFKNHWCVGELVDFVWGGTYRHTSDDIPMSHGHTGYGSFIPRRRKDDLFSLFLQNEFKFWLERLRFITGVRLDHYNYSGLEAQPTFRFLYSLGSHQDLWMAVSRAVRSPSRYNRDAIWILGPPANDIPAPGAIMVFRGSDDYKSEKVWSYEMGYRWRSGKNLTVDVTGFANFYTDLFSGTVGTPFEHHGYEITPIDPGNHGEGNTYGVELTSNVKPFKWWRVELSYSYLDCNFWVKSKYRNNTELTVHYMASPHHKVSVRSYMDLTSSMELDVWLRYTSSLSRLDIPAYTGLDIRFGYHPSKQLEFSIDGKDLLDPYHPEFRDEFLHVVDTEVPRSVNAKITWHF
ncbi:MAG: TonB-dependent receptor [Thermodesulfobacteria bacterium]|nr:TonB-dependent receptor [Thermodesulfobacteriota bacterium]